MTERGKLIAVGSVKKPTRSKRNRKRKLPKILSHDEVTRALSYLAEDFAGTRDRAALLLMYRAGLRVGEVVKLQPRDVNMAEGTITILDGKGGDGTAYFDLESVGDELIDWLEQRQGAKSSAFLFCHPDGRPLTTRYLQRLCTRLKEEAGIEAKFTPHVLRHTFATELLKEGFSLREVQTALRHANVGTTEIYTHVIDTELRAKVARRRRSEGGEP